MLQIVHELLEHERVYMQDENISEWHKGLFGRTVQHSVLGLVKAKLIKHERVIVLSSRELTTKYCPVCGKLKKDITLADRVYECSCGYREDRDIHAAKNYDIAFEGRGHTAHSSVYSALRVRLWQNTAKQPRRIATCSTRQEAPAKKRAGVIHCVVARFDS